MSKKDKKEAEFNKRFADQGGDIEFKVFMAIWSLGIFFTILFHQEILNKLF